MNITINLLRSPAGSNVWWVEIDSGDEIDVLLLLTRTR